MAGRDRKSSGKLKRPNRIKLYSRKQHGHWKQSISAKGPNKKRNSPWLQRNETIKTMRKQSTCVCQPDLCLIFKTKMMTSCVMRKQSTCVCLRVYVCITKHGQGFLQYIFKREGWIGLIHSLLYLEKVMHNSAGGDEARPQCLRKRLSK